MSDNYADVVLVTDDPQLSGSVSAHKPRHASLCCIGSSESKDSALPPAGEYWLDLDAGIAPDTSGCRRRVHFCSQLPERPTGGPAALLLKKPCSDSTITVLWAGVAPAANRLATGNDPQDPRPALSLPDWLLDLHDLDLRRFCQLCVDTVPDRLGYAEMALYLHDAEQRLLTLAESSSRRRIDLAVPLTPDDRHPLAVVACRGELLITDDLAETCRLRGMHPPPGPAGGPGPAAVIAPLMTRGTLHGVLQLTGRRAIAGAAPVLRLDRIFEFLARCLEHARSYQQARVEARVDRLTGLFNYRWMMEALDRETQRSQRYGSPLSLIMIDLDGLKSVNDRFGHLGGDALLRHTARKVSAALRQIDLAARIGGDEFVVLLPATNLDGARRVGQRILASMRTDAPLINTRKVPVAASLGVAQWEDGWDEERLLGAADQAMYAAKRQGHNRLVCHRRRPAVEPAPARQVQ